MSKYANFTDEEQACIEREIRKLRGEGKPEDQAVAIAINACAPDKATSASAIAEASFSAYSDAPLLPAGGQFKWSENPDGTFNLYGIPIFFEHERDGHIFDEERLRSMLDTAKRRRSGDGYVGPLHVNHHFRDEPVHRAGFFQPRKVGLVTYEGRQRHAIFADFLHVEPHIFNDIQNRRLPYWSVELDRDREEINSVALMSHATPFFRAPLLTVGEEQKTPVAMEYQDGMVVAYDSTRESVLSRLFSTEDVDMHRRNGSGQYQMDEGGEAPAVDQSEIDQSRETLRRAMEEFATGLQGVVPAIQAAIEEKLGISLGGGESSEDTEEPEEAPETAPVEMAADDEDEKEKRQMDAYQARNDALTARLQHLERQYNALASENKKRTEENKRRSAVQKTYEELLQYGAGAEQKATLERMAKDSLERMYGYAEAFKNHAPVAPPPMIDGELPTGARAGDTKEVLGYRKHGPEVLEKARQYGAEWESAGETMKNRVAKNSYIRSQLEFDYPKIDFGA